MKSRKAELPKREPHWSAGGQRDSVFSIESKMERILWMLACVVGTWIEDILLSAADSEREKMKERMREYVGDERKISWSWEDKMRRVGFWKIRLDTSDGGGRLGVCGNGRGFCEGAFLRGMSRGSLF